MFKKYKTKLILIIIVLLGGYIMTKSLFIFHNRDVIRKSQDSNVIENYTKNSLTVSKNSILKELNSIHEEINLSDDAKDNKDNVTIQKSPTSKIEESKNINDKNNQKNTNFQLEETNYIDDRNNQKNANSQLEETNYIDNKNNQKNTDYQLVDINSNIEIESTDNIDDTLEEEKLAFNYDRTTSIYANDNVTLLRVEYYINNKLTYYSVIENFDVATKSYTENIYKCNRETNIDSLIRTDIYVNGNLEKSY